MFARNLIPGVALALVVASGTLFGAEEAAPTMQVKIFKLQNLSAREAQASAQVFCQMQAEDLSNGPLLAIGQSADALFVRGTSTQIAEMEKLLKAIDQPADKLAEAKLTTVDLLPVHHIDPRQVQVVLNQLKIRTSVMQIGRGGMLAVGPDQKESLNEVREVLKALDVNPNPMNQTAVTE